MTTVVEAVIDEQNPWPGLGSFDEGADRFFNGRRNESAELRRLVLNAPLTVLFGASGLGKTSLLQAGLFPLLRKEHYLPVYVRLDFHDRTAPLIDQITFALQAQFKARGIDAPSVHDDESIWIYLHRAGLELWSAQNQLLTPVFVFDQFEEVFTTGGQNPGAVARLRIDLADLIENRVPAAQAECVERNEAADDALSLDSQRYKVVLSFREDFLPAVEGWKRELPSILRNRLRLLPMSGEQAFEAVHTTASHLVDEPLARQIVRFVAAAQEDGAGKATETPDGMSELAVEPALLSLVCHGLNEKRKAQNKSVFHETLLKGTGQSIISDYYKSAVGDLSESAQRFIRNELITERGFRKPCDIDDARSVHGVTDRELRLLVDRRVLRIEPQRGTERVELTHDLLTRVVREHRDRERERAKVRQQRRRMRIFAAATVMLAGLVMVFGWLYLDGRKQRLLAEQQTRIATARRLTAEAETTSNQRPRSLSLATLLAVESIKRYPTLEADQFLRHGLPLLPRSVGRPMKHHGPVQAIAFSPDGTHLATASWDGTAGVWEAATGRQVFTVTPGQVNDRVSAVAFSPNGTFLATADFRGTAQVWDATNGRPVGQAIEPKTGPVKAVAFPDGSYLATVTDNGADVWEINANQKVFSTPKMDGTFSCIPLSSFVISPDGTHAAAACHGQVRIWEIATWSAVVTIPKKNRPGLVLPLHPIAFSADGKFLASADEVYEASTGTLVQDLHSQGQVTGVVFSHDGGYIALAAGDIVRVLDVSDGVQFAELHHAGAIRAVAFSPGGHEIATASDDNTARIWHVNRYSYDGPTQEVTRVSHEGKVSSVDFSPDGKYLATASEDGTAGVWRVDGEGDAAHQVHGGTQESVVALSSTGRFLAIAVADSVRVLEAAGGREVGHVAYNDPSDSSLEIDRVSCSPDGHYLWTAVHHHRGRRGSGGPHVPEDIEKTARVWDVFRGEEVARIKYDDVPRIAVFSPDARHLVADDGTTVQVWDVTGGREVARVKHEPASDAPIFSADGGYLAIVEPKAIRILETNGWREVRSLPVAARTFPVVAFSRNGKYIAGGSNEIVRIWEVIGGREIKSLSVKYATGIVFGPDGKYLVTANWNFNDPFDRSVRIWDIDDQREVGRLQLQEEGAGNADVSNTQLAFSNDGRYLATENHGTVRIWDMLKRQETERWETRGATELVFSPDGKYLLAGDGKRASVWLWGPEAMVADACSRVGRNLTPDEWRQFFGDEPYRKTCAP